MFRVLSVYMHLNMLLLPALGYGADSSWSLVGGIFTWRRIRKEFIFGTASIFYLTLLLQQISLGFLNVLLRITDLFNFLFRPQAINKFYIGISEKPWLKFECDTFDYGYYYAMYTTLINVTNTFGYSLI